MLILSSRQTLLAYTGTSKDEFGVNDLIRSRLKMINEELEPHERLVCLKIYDMQIKKALVYVRTCQIFCGYVDFGQFNMLPDSNSTLTGGNSKGKSAWVAKTIYKEIET